MRTPGAMRLLALESPRTTSTSLGSFSVNSAKRSAMGDGSTSLRSTVLPSALDTITWDKTTMSPSNNSVP